MIKHASRNASRLYTLYIVARCLRSLLKMYNNSQFVVPKSSGAFMCIAMSYIYARYGEYHKSKQDYARMLEEIDVEIQETEEKKHEHCSVSNEK